MNSSASIDTFKLELARPGPLYGQLLSTLTNYLALCDGVEADTFQLPFLHHEIEEDLQGLRYQIDDPDGGHPVPNTFRAACLERLSSRLGKTLQQMHGFQTRFAESSNADLTHLRLLLNGGELSLVPFELSDVPLGWRGSGGKLTRQSRARTVLTRELRDSCRYPLEWNREPRVLFCTAKPAPFAAPPVEAHLVALSRAIRPWGAAGRNPGRTLRKAEDFITVIEDASLDAIAEATHGHEYTHVHVLAHGCQMPGSRDRYGLALSKRGKPGDREVVDARALATVLWGQHRGRKPPTLVTLASCDSANQSGVMSPGSSVAHELHREGVPWVVASQMPLTYRGSATLARVLYQGLFAGDDPRWVLHKLRAELARDPESHDWASLVVYAAFPDDFDAQVRAFAVGQIRSFINSAFRRAEEKSLEARNEEFELIQRQIARWEGLLPKARGRNDADRSEFWGMRGAIAKQLAPLAAADSAEKLLREAAGHYQQAASLQLGNHWVMVQYLSLRKVLNLPIESGWFEIAERSAALDLDQGGETRSWAEGSLLELALLRDDGKALGTSYGAWATEFNKGLSKDSFPYFSTKRQLERYTTGAGSGRGFGVQVPELLAQRAQELLAQLARE